MIRSFEAVGLVRTGREFRVVKELLNVNVAIKAHGDAIYNLKFLQKVVCPVSLWQIQKETSR
jgi:hypothetical protein